MYRRGIRPSRSGDEQCYVEMARLQDTFFAVLQRRNVLFARNPLLDEPLVEYIFRYVLPTVRCPRVHMWLRVRAQMRIPPVVRARTGAYYVAQLENELEDLRHRGAFDETWSETYALLQAQELELTRRAYGA